MRVSDESTTCRKKYLPHTRLGLFRGRVPPAGKKSPLYLTWSCRISMHAWTAIDVCIQQCTQLAVLAVQLKDCTVFDWGKVGSTTPRASARMRRPCRWEEKTTMVTSVPQRVNNLLAFLNSHVQHMEKYLPHTRLDASNLDLLMP
jgi:hypothetical protein